MEAVMPVGPSLEELSPLKPKKGRPQFPVVAGLPEALLRDVIHPVDDIAYVLATCSGYAYSDADTVAMMMARMGLFENHCVEFKLTDDAMFINSTAYLVQSKDGRIVILCYKGTAPLDFIDWLLDADLDPEKISLQLSDTTPNPDHWVHSGFYRNMRATRYKVIAALDRAMHAKSVITDHPDPKMNHPLEALYITGHSLGGAMAALMALALRVEPAYEELLRSLRAVYTFGQPMLGPPAIAEYCRTVKDFPPLIRYVHRRDVVPHLPPRESGTFAHFGTEYQYEDQDERWKPRSPSLRQVNLPEFAVLAPAEFVIRKFTALRNVSTVWNGLAGRLNKLSPVRLAAGLPFEDAVRLPLVYSFDDHSPNHYISKLAPAGVMSEFGDVR
jgi:hypothetical protein